MDYLEKALIQQTDFEIDVPMKYINRHIELYLKELELQNPQGSVKTFFYIDNIPEKKLTPREVMQEWIANPNTIIIIDTIYDELIDMEYYKMASFFISYIIEKMNSNNEISVNKDIKLSDIYYF